MLRYVARNHELDHFCDTAVALYEVISIAFALVVSEQAVADRKSGLALVAQFQGSRDSI